MGVFVATGKENARKVAEIFDEFDNCYKHKVYWHTESLHIPIIRLDDLPRNKQTSACPKDLQNIDALRVVKAKKKK